MAEFQEVMRQWRRMCDKHQCADKECSAVAYDLICPITISHNGYPCDSGFVDCSPESMAQVEQIVMEWAAEHPEPVYQTWMEYINNEFTNSILLGTNKEYNTIIEFMKHTPIPADIADKLGIKPKKVTNGG